MFSKIAGKLVAVSPLAIAGSAFAALPESVSGAVTTAQTDGITLVGLMAAAGAAVYLIAKLLKRFGVFL